MVYGCASLRFAVYISWFTAAPVYASRFTFHGLRLRQFTLCSLHYMVYGCASLRFAVYISWFTPGGRFTLRGLHFMVYGCASLRFAVYITWFTAAPVDAARFTFHGLRLRQFTLRGLHFMVYALLFKGLLDSP
jgi:hypothetical protein